MNYYILKSKYIGSDDTYDDNHLLIHVKAIDNDYSLAFNIKSNLSISHMHYLVKKYNKKPSFIPDIKEGLYHMEPISYFIDKIVDRDDFICSNEEPLQDIEPLLINSKYIISIGELWSSEDTNKPFDFYPNIGMHDIHANDNKNDGLLCLEYDDYFIVIFIYFVRID